jgi:hypothetical protein
LHLREVVEMAKAKRSKARAAADQDFADEISAVIAAHVRRYGLDLMETDQFYRPFDAVAPRSATCPWTDLRASERRGLRRLLEAAEHRAAERARAIIIKEATRAAVAFAAEFPDAPRA